MARFTDEAAANKAGYGISHEPEHNRFVLTFDGAQLGEAHYTQLANGGFDFDHTEVDPSLRGTGLSDLLARHALTHETVFGQPITASCWFVAGLLEKHPELAASTA